MTKKEERQALEVITEMIQEKFTKMFGFAPAKKDIIPLECSYTKWMDEWIVEDMGFRVKKIGWVITKYGEIERAEQYDYEA